MAHRFVRPDTAFTELSRAEKRPREIEEVYLGFIRLLPCLACGRFAPSEAAHIRFGDPRAAKRGTGGGERPSDRWAVPLCGSCHRTGKDAQHGGNEESWWWHHVKVDVIFIAMALYAACPNIESAFEIISHRGRREPPPIGKWRPN